MHVSSRILEDELPLGMQVCGNDCMTACIKTFEVGDTYEVRTRRANINIRSLVDTCPS